VPDKAAPLRPIYRVLAWSSFILLLIILALVLRKPSLPQIPYDPSAVARVDQKFAAADQAKAAGQPSQVQLTPSELSSYLAQNLRLQGAAVEASASGSGAPGDSGNPGGQGATNGAPNDANAGLPADGVTIEQVQSSVKDVKVDMDGDLVKAYVTFDFHGKDLALELDGHLGSQDGYLKFVPVAGKLGSLPLPQSALDSAVEKMMASPENREKMKLPADVSDIQIVDGQAVVSYK
jgi:hypothetical protein